MSSSGLVSGNSPEQAGSGIPQLRQKPRSSLPRRKTVGTPGSQKTPSTPGSTGRALPAPATPATPSLRKPSSMRGTLGMAKSPSLTKLAATPPPTAPKTTRTTKHLRQRSSHSTFSAVERSSTSHSRAQSIDLPDALEPAPVEADSRLEQLEQQHQEQISNLTRRLNDLDLAYRKLQTEHARCVADRAVPERRLPAQCDPALVSALYDLDSFGQAVRSIPKNQRLALLSVIVESCRPSDIQAQIDLLEEMKTLRTGVLARLDDQHVLNVMRHLNRRDVLNLRLVSRRFSKLGTSPVIWRKLCQDLEASWDGTIDLSNYNLPPDGDWLGLYKRLWQREQHWTNGLVQSLVVLDGHKGYVTSLALCGETLISASYDDTIRIWHLPYAVASPKSVPPPIVIPAKSVSDLDYYAPEQVLVTGSHDVGRAMIWRPIDGEWKVDKILSGHLHGTRAVAINAQWMVSVGSDKAIVVWDWRTGNKLVRFGQQTNVCIGMNLLDNFIISATVDGIIRTFSIAKREMIGQFRLSDLAQYQPEFADKLKDVGVGALGMLTWFKAEGRFMACATKDIVIRLAWDWADEEEQADNLLSTAPVDTTTAAATLFTDTSPTAATPTRRTAKSSSLQSPGASGGNGPVSDGQDDGSSHLAGTTSVKYALARRPTIVEILDITGTERGAFEAGRVRIVTSRRLSSKAGAERRVIVGTEYENGDHLNMKLVPLGGAWDSVGRAAGLHASAKNPMSLALDHDKLVYGCSDGSVVVANFVGISGQTRTPPASGSLNSSTRSTATRPAETPSKPVVPARSAQRPSGRVSNGIAGTPRRVSSNE